jgi:hypothetical protein
MSQIGSKVRISHYFYFFPSLFLLAGIIRFVLHNFFVYSNWGIIFEGRVRDGKIRENICVLGVGFVNLRVNLPSMGFY